MVTKKGPDNESWIGSFTELFANFCELLPCTVQSPVNYPRMALAACRARRLAKLMPEALAEVSLSRGATALVGSGIQSMRKILGEIEARLLSEQPVGFAKFDDERFFKLVRSLPKEEVHELFRAVIADPATLSPLARLQRTSILQKFGLTRIIIDAHSIASYKVIIILILIVIAIENRPLVRIVIVVVRVLVIIDRIGHIDQGPIGGAPGTAPPVGGGGGPIPVPGGGTVSPGGENTVVVLPNGRVVIVTPDGRVIIVEPNGDVTFPTPPPPPPLTPPPTKPGNQGLTIDPTDPGPDLETPPLTEGGELEFGDH